MVLCNMSNGATARVIDLQAYRAQTQRPQPVPVPTAVPVTPVVWVPVFFWVPLWRAAPWQGH